MKLFNTLSRQLETFAPLDGETARIYTCGPTVYNFAHIGNLSSYIFADTLRRAVKLAGFETRQVMNLTDVDDKTIRDSRAEFPDLPPRDALAKLTTHYSEIFLREMREIGCDISEIKFVKATDNIAEMQNLIKKLLRENIAYIADDGIYFSIREYQKTRKYGQLSKIEIAKSAVARIDNDEYDKENAQDFALWKFAKIGEPSWDFEIDGENLPGRPGWHIECSAMSVKNLGQPFDIHTGGVDLIFPHHENEIAQSTAGDQPQLFAKFFIHNEHLLVDGKKMSKSAHNFYTLNDIRERGFDPLDFRMLVLQSHYRKSTNFSWENLAAAKNRRKNWRNIFELRWQLPDDSKAKNDNLRGEISRLMAAAKNNLLDDLNTPSALATIDQILGRGGNDDNSAGEISLPKAEIENLLNFIDENLGLKMRETTPDILDEEKILIREREAARREKDFAKSDQIRDELLARGIELKDAANQTIWSRK